MMPHYTTGHAPDGAMPFEVPTVHFFIARPDITTHTVSGTMTTKGAIVPVIPVDQLPPWLEVEGVPRELDVEQVGGLTNLGILRKVFDYYNVYLDGARDGVDVSTGTPTTVGQNTTISNQAMVDTTPSSRGQAMPESATGSSCSSGRSSNCTLITPTSPSKPVPMDTCVHSPEPGTLKPSSPHQNRYQGPLPPPLHPARGLVATANRVSSSSTSSSSSLLASRHAKTAITNSGSSYKKRPIDNKNSNAPSTSTITECGSNEKSHGSYGRGGGGAGGGSGDGASDNSSSNKNTTTLYCRHWCHHGTCKWLTECRYMHTFPPPSRLHEVGLADYPAWYRAGLGLARDLLRLGQGGGGGGGGNDHGDHDMDRGGGGGGDDGHDGSDGDAADGSDDAGGGDSDGTSGVSIAAVTIHDGRGSDRPGDLERMLPPPSTTAKHTAATSTARRRSLSSPHYTPMDEMSMVMPGRAARRDPELRRWLEERDAQHMEEKRLAKQRQQQQHSKQLESRPHQGGGKEKKRGGGEKYHPHQLYPQQRKGFLKREKADKMQPKHQPQKKNSVSKEAAVVVEKGAGVVREAQEEISLLDL